MNNSFPKNSKRQWLDLAEAADYLGVHFTTLRRWADENKIPHIRTAGGRRRFAEADLERFLQKAYHPGLLPAPAENIETRSLAIARLHVRQMSPQSNRWIAQFSDEDRLRFRSTGKKLLGLLLQYNSRTNGGDEFIEEGKSLAREYGIICREAGLSIDETVAAFLFFRRSIVDTVAEAGLVASTNDIEGLRLHQRTNDFLDHLLLATVDSYTHSL